MNVIMIVESAHISGGAEKVAISTSMELRNRGIRVGYITADSSLGPELDQAGVETLLLDSKSFFEETDRNQKLKKLIGNFSIEEPVREFMRSFPPAETVIHAHTYRLKLSGYVLRILQKLGYRVVIHCHDYSSVCPTSLLFNYQTQSNCDLKPLSLACVRCNCQIEGWKYKIPKLTSSFANRSLFHLYQKTVAFVHISPLAESIVKGLIKTKGAHYLVRNPQDLEALPKSDPSESKEFVYIGRLTKEKAPEQFLQAAKNLGVTAVIVGDGPERTSLQAQFPEATFKGWLKPEGVQAQLRQSRALVMPSLWRETYGLSVVDAMSHGIPCITSDVIGAAERIEHGVSGLIYAVGDVQALTEAMRTMLDNETARRMSDACHQAIWDNPPTITKHVDEMMNVYSRALA